MFEASSRGGRGGRAYLVAVDSLPPELRARLPQPAEPAPVPIPPGTAGLGWRLEIVQRVRETPPGTPERTAAVARLAREVTWPDGPWRGRPVGERSIRRWIAEFERGGMGELADRRRGRSGAKPAVVSRAFDKLAAAHGVPPDGLARIAAALDRYCAGLWARLPRANAAHIARCAPAKLAELLREAGCAADEAALKAACRVPQRFVDRTSAAEAAAIYRLDKGRSAAVQVPRIARDRSGLLPMEWVAGDVHPVDVAFRRDDGAIAYPRMVAFQCLATNRVFARCFFLAKGEAIRREHVLAAYAEMIATWGQPRNLYVDNGAEFRWSDHAGELCRYAHLWDDRELAREPGMLRALPYRPQSKVIEAAFASMTKTVFPLIPGYTGGDRVKPKTQNAGKAVTPFPGAAAELDAAIARGLALWHDKPQRGHLAGKSPNQRHRELCDAGWRPAVVERGELELHFSDLLDRTVTAGGTFSLDGVSYRHDALIALAGTRHAKVYIRRPLFGDRSRLHLFDRHGKHLGLAERARPFAFGDPAGAREQSRQAGVLAREVRAVERRADRLDPLAEAERAAGGARPPDTPAPAAVLSISPEFAAAAEAARSAADPPDDAGPAQTDTERTVALWNRLAAARSA